MREPLLVDVPAHLETERLVLRPFRAGDAQALYEALAESIGALREFLGHLSWVAELPTLASAQIRCRRCEANFLLRTDLPYLAFAKDTGRLVGSVGLHRTDWDLPRTEVGYWTRSSAAGQGYASEGVMALTRWALQGLGAQRVDLVTDASNVASRRVAERCGFALEATLRHMARGPDGSLRSHCIYARFPPPA